MCWCHMKERSKSTSSSSYLTKSESRFGFSTPCFLCLLSTCVNGMGLNLCLTEGYLVNLCFCLCLLFFLYMYHVTVPHKGLCSVFIEQHQKHHMEEEMKETSQTSSTDFYKGLSHYSNWPQRNQIINSIINICIFQAMSKCCVQHLWCIFILEDCFQPLFLLLLANDTCVLSEPEVWKNTQFKITPMH